MAKTLYAADPGALVHTGPGKLCAILLSTTAASSVAVTLYDNTAGSGTVLMTIGINPWISPVFITFPEDIPTTFATGLYLSIPANTTCYVWAIGF